MFWDQKVCESVIHQLLDLFGIYMNVFLAVGEPPLCMSCSALFAVKRAIEDARKDSGHSDSFILSKSCFGEYLN